MSESFEIIINSSLGSYPVSVATGNVLAALSLDNSVMLIDEVLPQYYPWLVHSKTIVISAVEENKTLDSVALVIERLRDHGANRKTHLIAIGGGIVQDIATFVASSYMRGIKWTYCPTTLLGMVDSCIGGKSSINVGRYKNIAGNFFPPDAVLVDPEFCKSLPLAQKIEGLCEAVKICFAGGDEDFEGFLAQMKESRGLDEFSSSRLIDLSLRTKKRFIEEDEFDNGVRLLLNFGHTFGHAIEGASQYQVSHGVAVGIGILCAVEFSDKQGFCSRENMRVQALSGYLRSILRDVPHIKENLRKVSSEDAFQRFRSDKKHQDGNFAVIVFDSNGFLVRKFVPSTDRNIEALTRIFENLGELI